MKEWSRMDVWVMTYVYCTYYFGMDIFRNKSFCMHFYRISLYRLPDPALPSFTLLPDVLLDAFVITMVSYTITMSMALIFAQKLHYEVDSNQELLAQVSLQLQRFSTDFFNWSLYTHFYFRVSVIAWDHFSRVSQ